MMLSAVVVLLALSKALSYNPIENIVQRPEILLAKWTPRDIYTLEKICKIAEVSKYRRNPLENAYEDNEYENLFANKLTTRKNLREIEHCCNKYTTHEKKQCMKDVRENYLDNYCDKGLDHVCCKNEYENRYTCFAKNPFRRVSPVSYLESAEDTWVPTTSRRMQQKQRELLKELAVENMESNSLNSNFEDEDRFSYLEKMDDIRGILRPEGRMEVLAEELLQNGGNQRNWARDLEENVIESLETGVPTSGWFDRTPIVGGVLGGNEWETLETLNEVNRRCVTPGCNLESKIQLDNEFLKEKLIESQTPCLESHQCRVRLEHATKAAAEQVCSVQLKGGRNQVSQCCRAGALVGKMVGRKNEQVCTPALFKFHAKTESCMNNKQACKQAFVQCCHERADRARNERVSEKDYIRNRAVENDLVRDDIFEEPTFYNRRSPFF